MRLSRTDLTAPGYCRRRTGRGFSFRDADGRPLPDSEMERVKALAIPPAWKDVWICPLPGGHIQATGVDAAGRRQYLYHTEWRVRRDAAKFSRVVDTAARLPVLRRRVTRDLRGHGLTRPRVLACVARLLDVGLFRVGGDEYANGDSPTFGIATLLVRHVSLRGSVLRFTFRAKGGLAQEIQIDDAAAAGVVSDLVRAGRPRQRLFAYEAADGSRRMVRSRDINEYLRQSLGDDITAKDFRTWHATVLAAHLLADAGPQPTEAARRKAIASVMREVAGALGNTPAVARSSYVDPRLLERFRRDVVADGPTESAVKDLLSNQPS